MTVLAAIYSVAQVIVTILGIGAVGFGLAALWGLHRAGNLRGDAD